MDPNDRGKVLNFDEISKLYQELIGRLPGVSGASIVTNI
jgi:hypothetical protein